MALPSAEAGKHLSRQEYQLVVRCCDEILALPTSCFPASSSDHCVRLQALLYRVSAFVQLKKFTEAEEDSKSVMCLQEVLGDGTLKDLLINMLLDGLLKEMWQSLFNCEAEEWMNEDNMIHFRQLLLLLTESQVSSSAARVSDEDGREGILAERRWKHRSPPRGVLGIDEYTLCLRFLQGDRCALGEFCVSAHSHGELLEWRERLVYRRLQGQQVRNAQVPADSYVESLIEKWISNPLPNVVVAASVAGVTVDCVPGLQQITREKSCSLSWTLQLHCNPPRVLHRVSLLKELHSARFSISGVAAGRTDALHPYPFDRPKREWSQNGGTAEQVYQVTLVFSTQAFGSFRQTVAFDFGSEPTLLQTVLADLTPPQELELEPEPKAGVSSVRWDVGCKQVAVMPFRPLGLTQQDQSLLQAYQIPSAADQLFTRSVLDRGLSPLNYHSRLHDLLYIEENAQYKELSRFHIQTCLRIVTEPTVSDLRGSSRPLLPGQLFAQMGLSGSGGKALSGGRERVYEALVEACCPEYMLLRLSEEFCNDVCLQPGRDLQVELQFQLNRLPLCEMHYALDSLSDCSLLFPEPPSVGVPLSFYSCSVDGLVTELNEQQREALRAITAPLSMQLPPVLLCGPPGSGKTYALVRTIGMLLRDDVSKVLLCTHSEAAADSITTDLLSLMEHSLSQGWLLRLQEHGRPVRTVPASVQRCCLIGHSPVEFLLPGRVEVTRSRAVVSTLRQTRHLFHLGLDSGHFTHILIDEASSSPECETLMALSLANRSTRVVLAGDPAQLPPLVYSEFARERGLQRPLLERLCCLYPQECSFRVQLVEQYRAHHHIVSLVSQAFYGGELRTASKQPKHKDFFPLSFFVVWGTDKSSCGYYNYAEVLEVTEQVESLCKKWPVSWGKLEEGCVGVLTPYPSQARLLRSEIQRRGLHCVTVQTVVTQPARCFRVLFLSTVRTRHSYKQQVPGGVAGGRRREPVQEEGETAEDRELGFLSSFAALHSVLLCSQSLLAVAGDPVALCTMGKCRRIWERFLSLCASEGSLHGATLSEVQEQMDCVETSRGCVLNPLAPEFVPRGPASPGPIIPRVMVNSSPFQRFKQPLQRDRYGQMGPCAPPVSSPYLLSLSSGRPCVYRRSPSPLPRMDPLGRTSLASCSGYAPRRSVDPRAVAYNLNLLRSPTRRSSVALAQRPGSPLGSYRSPTEGTLDLGRAGREDVSVRLGTLRLVGEADVRDQVLGAVDFRCSRSPWLHDFDRSPTLKPFSVWPHSNPTSPIFDLDNSPPSFRVSSDSGLPGPGHSSFQNGSHVSTRESLWRGEGGLSRYSPQSNPTCGLAGPLLSLPFRNMLTSRAASAAATLPPSPSKTIGSLAHEIVNSLGTLQGFDDPVTWSSTAKPLQYRALPTGSCPPSMSTPKNSKTFTQLSRTDSSFPSPISPLSEPDSPCHLPCHPERFAAPQYFQRTPKDQLSQSWMDLCSSPRPDPLEQMPEEWAGGRRLYQRGYPALRPTPVSPSPKPSEDSSSTGSTSPVPLYSVWDQEEGGERIEQGRAGALVSSPVHGEAQTHQALGQGSPVSGGVRPNDPLTLLQELGRRGDQSDSAYYTYFQ